MDLLNVVLILVSVTTVKTWKQVLKGADNNLDLNLKNLCQHPLCVLLNFFNHFVSMSVKALTQYCKAVG